MPLYDCMLLLKPHVQREGLIDLMTKVGKHVYRRNGVITDLKVFGPTELGYGIKKLDGRYYKVSILDQVGFFFFPVLGLGFMFRFSPWKHFIDFVLTYTLLFLSSLFWHSQYDKMAVVFWAIRSFSLGHIKLNVDCQRCFLLQSTREFAVNLWGFQVSST